VADVEKVPKTVCEFALSIKGRTIEMKRGSKTLALLFVVSVACFARSNDSYKDSKPAPTNVPGVEFPRVDSQSRAMFRVEAPNAQIVQLDLKEVYDMAKGEDGVWTVTTKPLDPGFHYYYLMIDGYRFSDPASESFFGVGKMMSGIEIPAPDQAFYMPTNVPHGQIRECYYLSEVGKGHRRFFVYTPPDYDSNPNTRYPVLYLQHGMGEDERGWVTQGKMNICFVSEPSGQMRVEKEERV
jgi:hypothetical protein